MIFLEVFAIETTQNRLLLKHRICLTDSNHENILEEIEHGYKFELEINSRDDGSDFFVCFKPNYFNNR